MDTVRLAPDPAVRGSVRRDRLLTLGAAVVVGLVVWIVARLVLGHDLRVTAAGSDSPTTVGPVAVVVTTLVGGLIAWGVLVLAERISRRTRPVWLVVGIVVLLLSLAGPFTRANGTGAAIALLREHLVVGGVLIAGLLRTIPSRRV